MRNSKIAALILGFVVAGIIGCGSKEKSTAPESQPTQEAAAPAAKTEEMKSEKAGDKKVTKAEAKAACKAKGHKGKELKSCMKEAMGN